MALGNLFKLEMLKIVAYKDRKRGLGDMVDSFEAMFNPETIAQKYEVKYAKAQSIGSSGNTQNFTRSAPPELNLHLVLDGSGTTEMGLMQLFPSDSVSTRVRKFLKLTWAMNDALHEPNYLVAKWGDINFNCRLASVDVSYTNFDRDGTPLRATLDVKLISDETADELQKMERKSSPDVSHSRLVKAGDTLPLLAKEIYGSSAYHLWIAQANGLDEIRRLRPGQRLIFPPLPDKAGN
ncbi:MAG: LysM peptidoglycan-binding domain-containing protein [Rhodocyclaceae bacterium]|nr:LysM peptidoglycan-binding domain-containing protein [Rhodocyclaceae bacterium]MBX3667533.1 LysM peptidoglycan-binding domain-containing protein [Rhodocyclaceae bacterium]